MRINYFLGDENHTFKQIDDNDLSNLNFLLTNSKGDFLNLGVSSNSCKYQGFNVCKTSNVEFFKFIESITPSGVDVDCVNYFGNRVERVFKSKFTQELVCDVSGEDSFESDLGDNEFVEKFETNEVLAKDSFFIGPTGGLVYEISNFEGDLLIDLDMRKKNDFHKQNRDYKVWSENGIVYVEFTKTYGNKSYKQFLGVKAQNFLYDLIEKFETKHYETSRLQNSDWKWPVFRFMDVKVLNSKKLFFGCGFSLEEVNNQIELLEMHYDELISISDNNVKKFFNDTKNFLKPLSQNVSAAYGLSENAVFNFLNSDLNNSLVGVGCFAGFPYFSNVWAKDDVFGLRALINLGEVGLVKKRIDFYLKQIDKKTGGIKNLLIRDNVTNFDITFILGKRIEDFLHFLIETGELNDIYSKKELDNMYQILNLAFTNIVKYNWDFDRELIKTPKCQMTRGGVQEEFSLNSQVLFLSYTSFMEFLSNLVNNDENSKKYLDFEEGLKYKIKSCFVGNGNLFADLKLSKITFDVFSAYYFYPELFEVSEWEIIFDKALHHLRNDWFGISSLSSSHKDFFDEHSGADGKSRFNGDSFYYMNNLAAICLHDLNYDKYKDVISKILSISTNDVLTCGTIGYSSELSSSTERKSEGNLAHFVSSSSYIEMIDKLFDKKII